MFFCFSFVCFFLGESAIERNSCCPLFQLFWFWKCCIIVSTRIPSKKKKTIWSKI